MSSIESLKSCKTAEEVLEFRRLAEYRARCFVNPMRRHGTSGKMEPVGYEFADRFLPHPWVRSAISEGWGKELRSHLVLTVMKRILLGEAYGDIDSLMPPKQWVDYVRDQAAQYQRAAEWQKANLLGGDLSGFLRRLIEKNRAAAQDNAA